MSKPKKGKRFVYSLKTLLNVRNIREKQQQEKFNAAEKKLHEERLEEATMKKEQTEHLNYVNSLLSSKELPSMTTIEMHQEHVKRMEEKVKKQQEVVKKSKEKRDEEQKELIQKVKEKKIIEKDKEKTRVKWKKMMDKLDSEFLDELASIKFASKMIKDDSEKKNNFNKGGIRDK
ncbi:hypothetical protein CL658_02345 [bacterium]|nr:hypothetical protein [bacterium]|tara:strand:+ start:3049 stop:3573 length:525 start_codon:yes stop_codon:yes gene_type:complete